MINRDLKQCVYCGAMMSYNHRLHCWICELCGASEDIMLNTDEDVSYIN